MRIRRKDSWSPIENRHGRSRGSGDITTLVGTQKAINYRSYVAECLAVARVVVYCVQVGRGRALCASSRAYNAEAVLGALAASP